MHRILAYLALILCLASTVTALEANWPRALANILVSEGGFSNDPHDPGGRTLNGVTQARYNQYRDEHGRPRRTLTAALARDPTWAIERSEIYKKYYGDPLKFAVLPAGIDYTTADYGVNSGPARAGKVLRCAVQTAMPIDACVRASSTWAVTPEIVAATVGRELALINAINDERRRFVHRLRTCVHFCAGWDRRIASVRTISIRMATPGLRGSADSIRPIFGAGHQRAREEDEEVMP